MTASDRLLQACLAGDTRKAVSALELEPGVANSRCEGIDSPAIVLAAHRGHLEIVRALIPADEHVDETTPLARAVSAGHLQAAGALLAGGADPNGCVGKSAITPLHLAARAGNAAMARLLLDAGGDRQRRDRTYHATPAGWAAHFHHDALVRML